MPESPLFVDDAPLTGDQIAPLRDALAAGGLVLLPTETVYGIAARADQAAPLKALADLKGRPAESPFTWHIGSPSAIDALGATSPPVSRLIERYWPGPLTLVLPDATNHLPHLARRGRVGIRLPAHQATASLLDSLPFPIAMTSANLHGAATPTDPEQLPQDLLSQLAHRVESGPARTGEASTILKLGRTGDESSASFELLREGLHDIEALRRTAGLQLLFVCTGNTCRSPLAEWLARRAIAGVLGCTDDAISTHGFRVQSAGIFASTDGPISRHSREQLEDRGIDAKKHRSQTTTKDLLTSADHIYCLSQSHLAAVQDSLPPDRHPSAELLDPSGVSIPDPIGGSRADYARCAQAIEALINTRLKDWA